MGGLLGQIDVPSAAAGRRIGRRGKGRRVDKRCRDKHGTKTLKGHRHLQIPTSEVRQMSRLPSLTVITFVVPARRRESRDTRRCTVVRPMPAPRPAYQPDSHDRLCNRRCALSLGLRSMVSVPDRVRSAVSNHRPQCHGRSLRAPQASALTN